MNVCNLFKEKVLSTFFTQRLSNNLFSRFFFTSLILKNIHTRKSRLTLKYTHFILIFRDNTRVLLQFYFLLNIYTFFFVVNSLQADQRDTSGVVNGRAVTKV